MAQPRYLNPHSALDSQLASHFYMPSALARQASGGARSADDAPHRQSTGSQGTTPAPAAEAARPLKVKIKFGKRKEPEAEAQTAAQQALQDLERIRKRAYAEALPEALPAEWDIPEPHARPAQHSPAAADLSQPPAAPNSGPHTVTAGPSIRTSRSSDSGNRTSHEGKRPRQVDAAVRNRSPVPRSDPSPGAAGKQDLPHHRQNQQQGNADQPQDNNGSDFVTIDSANSFETGKAPSQRPAARQIHTDTTAQRAQMVSRRVHSNELPVQRARADDSAHADPPHAKRQKSCPPDGVVHVGSGAAAKAPAVAHAEPVGHMSAGKAPAEAPAAAPVAPQAAYLNLYLAMAGEDVTMGKSAEAHHSLGRNTKHKGDMLRETRSGGGGKEVEEALSYAKAGVCFMRHAYMMEGQYTGSASKTVPLMDQNAAWLQRCCIDQGSSSDPVRKLARFLLERLAAVAQLRAAWVSRRSLDEECVRLRSMHHQHRGPAPGASLTPGHSRPPSPAPQHRAPQASGSSSGDKVPKSKLPPGGAGGTHPLAPSPSSNNSTNSAADAQGLGVTQTGGPSGGSLSGARGASGGQQGPARGGGTAVADGKAPPGAMLASRMRGVLQASERLKLSATQLTAMAPSITSPHGRRAIGALLLVGMDGLGGELRMSVAAAANALDAICSFSKERLAG